MYCEEAMKHLKSIGTVVYLKLSLDSLAKRLGNLKGRGVLLKDGQTLEEICMKNELHYMKNMQILL